MTGTVDSRSPASTRDADWRFLLPRASGEIFEHLVLLGGSEDLEAIVADLGIARRVSRTIPRPERADAAIVLAGATESLEAAVRCLGPTGVVYWEVDRRSPAQAGITPAKALGHMRRLGLNPTAAYWVKPGFPRREMYLPLGARRTFRWYLDTLYRSTTLPRRILKAALRAMAVHDRGLTAFAPCYAVTAVRDSPRPPALIDRACMAGAWNNTATTPVLLANGAAEWSRIALLLFEENALGPAVVIKVARSAVFNRHVEWEHSILRQLRCDLAPRLGRSIPSSLLFQWNDLAVSAESCVKGASLSSRAGAAARNVLDDLHLTASWLATFHRDTTLERVPARDWLTRHLINGTCAEYATTFGLTAAEQRLFATLSSRLQSATAGTLPIVWQHTDFGPWNVYRDQRDLAVIDWEVARRGPALSDLLYFVTHWSAAVAGPKTEPGHIERFRSLFCTGLPSSSLDSAVHREIAEYMRLVDIPPSLAPFLLVYTILEQALDRARRFNTLAHAQAAAAANRYLAFTGVMAEHASTLFGSEVARAA